MLKLAYPAHSYEQTLDSCCIGITGNTLLLGKVNAERQVLEESARVYEASASTGELHTLIPTTCGTDEDPLVVGQLKKSELIKLYGTYFVSQKKPGRIIYDSIMTAANEKCPFCGGVGRPRNLDHYLPKAHFPEFSVLPINLIPSCRDCNMDGKGETFATSEGKQVLHPYLDNDKFFNEQWLFARYLPDAEGEPGVIEYFVQAPQNWTDNQKARVEQHFTDFELGIRFSKEAGARLIPLLSQIDNLARFQLPIEDIRATILQPVINSAPFVNHWEKVMCEALIRDL